MFEMIKDAKMQNEVKYGRNLYKFKCKFSYFKSQLCSLVHFIYFIFIIFRRNLKFIQCKNGQGQHVI